MDPLRPGEDYGTAFVLCASTAFPSITAPFCAVPRDQVCHGASAASCPLGEQLAETGFVKTFFDWQHGVFLVLMTAQLLCSGMLFGAVYFVMGPSNATLAEHLLRGAGGAGAADSSAAPAAEMAAVAQGTDGPAAGTVAASDVNFVAVATVVKAAKVLSYKFRAAAAEAEEPGAAEPAEPAAEPAAEAPAAATAGAAPPATAETETDQLLVAAVVEVVELPVLGALSCCGGPWRAFSVNPAVAVVFAAFVLSVGVVSSKALSFCCASTACRSKAVPFCAVPLEQVTSGAIAEFAPGSARFP
eukprot:SAG22_NODE_3925_length_1466_cov_1.225311_1_plen_301_part_00